MKKESKGESTTHGIMISHSRPQCSESAAASTVWWEVVIMQFGASPAHAGVDVMGAMSRCSLALP